MAFATRNSPTTFYYGIEGIEGPEYELMRGFADYLGQPVALIVAPSAGEALNEVVRKRARIAAAGVVATPERQERLAFGPTYRTISQHLVYRRDRPAPAGPADLLGREVQVVAGSSHARKLAELQIEFPELRFVEVPDVDQLDLLARVSSGAIDFTVADSSEFSVGRHLHPDLARAFELSGGLPIAWALPSDQPELLEQVNAYFSLISQNGELERILSRYEAHEKNFDYLDSRDFVRLVQ
ncbi:MAG: transporter substrate-binding domain-containing protein, partial [Steroidobacteraceae bacterium]